MTSLFDQRNAPLATITPFSFEGLSVRTIQIDGEPWFVAADVCDALGLENTSQAVKGRADRGNQDGLDSEEQGVATVTTPSGDQQMLVVNESGLYSLTFKSRKPEAKRFKRWVTGEVLPTIRKTGSYNAPSLDTEEGKLLVIQEMAAKQLALIHDNKRIAAERDHAIKTKAQISDKKTATAMATASHLKRENNKLKDELGFNTRHATVIAVEGASGKKFGKQDWRPLKAWCKANGASSVTVPCARYGKAQAWPSGAWGAVYGVDLVELFGEVAA